MKKARRSQRAGVKQKKRISNEPTEAEECPKMNSISHNDSNGSFPEQIKMDPMKIELILETIFGFCSISTLKNCRLVSKQWKDLSLKAWRDKAILALHENRTNGRVSFKEYRQLLKDSEDTHHLRKFPFKGYQLIFTPGQVTKCLKSSLEPISKLTRHLILKNCKQTFSSFTSNLSNYHSLDKLELKDSGICESLNGLSAKPPIKFLNIKHLKISLSDHIYLHSSQESDYQHLLKCFPKVEFLCIETTRPHHVEFILKWSRSIMLPLKRLEILGISRMNSYNETLPKVFKEIIECNFPLERLTLDMECCYVTGDSFRRLLHGHKDTLQYLRIPFNPNLTVQCSLNPKGKNKKKEENQLEPWLGNFQMEELREIKIVNGFPGCMQLLVLLELPKLEKLILEHDSNSSKEMATGQTATVALHKGKVYENLKTFELHDNRKIPGEKMIDAFTKMMPHLNNLTIPLDKMGFLLVCERLRGLKTLNVLAAPVFYVEVDEETLTGVSKTKKEKKGERPPNITDLELLTDLSISCEVQLQRDDVKFTDHSVIHGFLQLPKLYYLSIAFKGLSKEIEEKLLNHVKGFVDIQQKTSRESDDDYKVVEIDSDYEFEKAIDSDDEEEDYYDPDASFSGSGGASDISDLESWEPLDSDEDSEFEYNVL